MYSYDEYANDDVFRGIEDHIYTRAIHDIEDESDESPLTYTRADCEGTWIDNK